MEKKSALNLCIDDNRKQVDPQLVAYIPQSILWSIIPSHLLLAETWRRPVLWFLSGQPLTAVSVSKWERGARFREKDEILKPCSAE